MPSPSCHLSFQAQNNYLSHSQILSRFLPPGPQAEVPAGPCAEGQVRVCCSGGPPGAGCVDSDPLSRGHIPALLQERFLCLDRDFPERT